ncbi:hypothetical protein BC938DRAFT_476515 [Jimgerdemannia flammicorona]|uniref:Uncharacterized protein n=1 Tax=Jimgerdemannia flammicorona TaxID=994334 RepID=A0A433QQE4_9FUNG|nr:hypothetical protein BC938DRAFT_476515 [Jimgerdemannia flammicorona]
MVGNSSGVDVSMTCIGVDVINYLHGLRGCGGGGCSESFGLPIRINSEASGRGKWIERGQTGVEVGVGILVGLDPCG